MYYLYLNEKKKNSHTIIVEKMSNLDSSKMRAAEDGAEDQIGCTSSLDQMR